MLFGLLLLFTKKITSKKLIPKIIEEKKYRYYLLQKVHLFCAEKYPFKLEKKN